MTSRFRPDRFTLALLATVAAMFIAAEVVSRAAFDRTSQVQRRELAQRNALLAVRDSPANATAHVAVVGNSLMLEGVQVPLLQERLAPALAPAPYFVLATDYYDWYFALKRLFDEGARPRYVLLGLSPNQLASFRTRGDYSARYLFEAGDLVKVARLTHMDGTTATGFMLSHFSEYYSTRDISRRFLMGRLMPQVGELLHNRLGTVRAPALDESALAELAQSRLPELDKLCRDHGADFMLVVPPSYQNGSAIIAKAGAAKHVTVLVPIADGVFDASHYQPDGFHLNQEGARIFTERLAAKLIEELAE